MNHKKRRRRDRKRATGERQPIPAATGPNQRRSLDFLSNMVGPGRRFRIPAMIDNRSRDGLDLVADRSLPTPM